MKVIITFEHSCLTAADFDDEQDFDWLIEQNFDVFRIERKQQQWQLKVRHYIGVIGLPSGGQVEILPKLAQSHITHADEVTQTRQWVQQMLTAVWQALFPKSLANLANQLPITPPASNHSLSLSEWLQAYFWQGFAQYVPNQQYQQFEQNQPYLQGKLLVKEQLQHNFHQPHKFYHQSENFVMDTAGNRLVKTTIERVIGSIASSPLSSPLLPQWQAVGTVAKDLYDTLLSQALQELTALPSLLAQRNYTFISFCYALLTLQQASSQGQFLTPTWLVNMPFAFEKWVDFDQDLFDSIYNDDSQEREFNHKIYGYDNNPNAHDIAIHNVKAAGVSKDVVLKLQPFQQFEQPKEKSMIIMNPPYGERISTKDLLGLYQMIGERLKQAFCDNDAWILSYREECFDQIGLKPSRKVPLFNGALECEFRKYQIFGGKYKEFKKESNEKQG